MTVLGVVGAGTMGAGIAQLGCQAGVETRLLDADAAVLERATERIERGIAKAASKGRAPEDAAKHLRTVGAMDELAGCDIVVEAVPERLDLKHRVLHELAAAVGDRCVIATNTSSIPVTQIAARVPVPERVVGLHFFNPAPVMKLVEAIKGIQSSDEAVSAVVHLGEQMGKRVIVAEDGPGFIVNRCNRPFNLEALSCLQEGMADAATIDRIVRLGGGFRMGPFELMDLVGITTGFDVARSFYELSFGEPRWRPNPIHAQQAASGLNWHAEQRAPDPEPPAAGGGDGLIVLNTGITRLSAELFDAAAEAGWEVATPAEAEGRVPFLIVDCDPEDPDAPTMQGAPRVLLLDGSSLAMLDGEGTSVGFHALPPLADSRLIELTATPFTPDNAKRAAERFFTSLGKHTAWVGDGPGLVLGRIVAQLVNESAFALGERIGIAEDIDAGMELGLNHPRGWLNWADEAGDGHAIAILAALHRETGDPRYRIAPAWRRAQQHGLTFHADPTLT